MDTLNQITAECFNAVSQFRELDGPIASPEMIHDRLRGYVEAMREKARDQSLSQKDADDIAYAIVALIDEIAMGKPEPMRGFWMTRPLQLTFFNETLAGEGFFQRLTEVRRDQRRVDVLRVYYQCLLFGFQGKYSMRGGEIELIRMTDSLRPEIERNIDVPDRLSPAGEPPDEPMIRSGRRNPILWIALGVFAVAIAVFISLRISLDREVFGLADRVDQLNR
ncbi:MAG TPA: DotU family type IV/VI secretion system protein [Polyangia bacterium]|jgi:type VI secretion system protein ImpK|nr:DotU family type IV/VI secretion system protein [Polyangia bacterium]